MSFLDLVDPDDAPGVLHCILSTLHRGGISQVYFFLFIYPFVESFFYDLFEWKAVGSGRVGRFFFLF